ncbi:MAG TPA: FtsQ-type POTRA domain-containing protein [Candidatus Limnocylindria bacterium]|nr:FtsQ-type POTRA domain-containing protein [Candidatus Limnocylindria bacterium]
MALAVLALAGAPRVATVSVSGTRHLTVERAVAATGLVGRPVFTTNTTDARLALLALPAVRDAEVRIALPDAAVVRIVEREAIGRWVLSGTEWYVDAEGVLFASVDPTGAPALRALDDRSATRACAGSGGGRCVDPAVVAGALRLARIAPGELRADALRPEVHVDPTQGLVVRSGAGWEIRFGTPDDLERKLANAKKVLSDNPTRRLDYVDVRSPDRIVFSPQ